MPEEHTRPSLLRHLMMMLYDALLLISALLFAATIAVAANGGEAIGSNNPIFLFYLLMVSLFFYGWFWTHGGQTLGMRAWKVYLFSQDGNPVTWKQAGLRFIGALLSWLSLGLGYAWQWFGKDKMSWADSLSATHLVLKKEKKAG